MTPKNKPASNHAPMLHANPWEQAVCLDLLEQLWALRKALQQSERQFGKTIQRTGTYQQASARNLAHYLAFRATDLRALQDKLAWLGVSSLGQAESPVMANLDNVLGILHRLTCQPWQDLSKDESTGNVTGVRLLQNHADALLGTSASSRRVRITSRQMWRWSVPDTSQLDLPALTEKDLVDLQTVAEVADLVGLSFVREPGEVQRLLQALHGLHRDDMGLVLKIETLRGFENLPALMIAAMVAPSAGVMIARGDLAVECGFERLAEIQEEILR